MANPSTAYLASDLAFKAPGASVLIVDRESGQRNGKLRIEVDGKSLTQDIKVILLEAKEISRVFGKLRGTPILHFPGGTRHSAGSEAGLSWYNDQGEGWLRIINPNHQIILMPLQGWATPSEAIAIPKRGKRGPPRSMDAWIAMAALMRPLAIDAEKLRRYTGINNFNIYGWLSQAASSGLILKLPSLGGRRDRFMVPPEQIKLLGEYVRASWNDWRTSRTMTRVRPSIRYFVANAQWEDFEQVGEEGLLPIGVTWLEGKGGGKSHIGPMGNIPRLSFICRESIWDLIVSETHIVPRSSHDRPYDSEAIILKDNHPIWHLIASCPRGPVHPAFPSGLRALDALNDKEPRVREAAEKEWNEWLEQARHQVEKRLDVQV